MDDICQDIHISKYFFFRQFKKVTGFTVMDYVLKIRIVASKNRLTDTAFPISEISSTPYFCRVFKEHTGLSPLQYRKNPAKTPL